MGSYFLGFEIFPRNFGFCLVWFTFIVIIIYINLLLWPIVSDLWCQNDIFSDLLDQNDIFSRILSDFFKSEKIWKFSTLLWYNWEYEKWSRLDQHAATYIDPKATPT
jgi:hypothetical protein